jgi:hypothetical protein
MKTLTSAPAGDSAKRLDQSLLPFPSYLEDGHQHGLADQATAAAFYHAPFAASLPAVRPLSRKHFA